MVNFSTLKRNWGLALCGSLLIAPHSFASAAGFPERPITLVVGFSAGGSNDIAARVISKPLSQALGVPVIVENRVGAAGTIGTSFVAKASPDGYTLMVSSASPIVVSPHTQQRVPYDARKDFAGIGLIGVTPEVLALNPGLPSNNLSEVIALAKTRDITVASSGNGGLPHLAIELLKRAAPGTRFLHVPYKGASAAVTDVLGGQVDGVVVDLPAVYNYITSKRLRGIAVADSTRSDFLPDLQTSGEQKLPAFVAVNWIGLLAPAKTPQATIDKLHTTLQQALANPEVKSALEHAAIQVRASETPASFQKFLNSEYEKWGKVVKDSGARAE